MAISSTFVTGQVFTAADANLMANSGLVYIKQQTVGSGVTSVAVSDAFSATYDNYVITLSGGAGTIADGLTLQLGAVTSGYKFSLIYTTYGPPVTEASSASAMRFNYMGSTTSTSAYAHIIVMNPFVAKNTFVQSTASNSDFTGVSNGVLPTTDSFTGFTLGTLAGTLTGGIIAVYGYRKA